jgi:glycosyltransferase involved in cell wall biosynthesis
MNPDPPIRVLHLTPQLSRAGGGASAYVWELTSATAGCGITSHVGGVADEWTAADTQSRVAASIFAGRAMLNPASGFSRELRRYLDHELPKVDLVHSHGLRNGIGLAALHVAAARKIPLLVTPHGMLYPQLMRRGRFKKWIVNRLWDDRYRAAASALHATSGDEAQLIRSSGASQPIAVVPIGINVEQFAAPRGDFLSTRFPRSAGKKRLLFLGIMDRKKGLIQLADAWGKLRQEFPDWHLIIAGPDFDGHAAEVREVIGRGGAAEATTFAGPVYGQDKARLYRESDLFVLPTEWENFGIAVAEALASELPVITTRGTPWQELESSQSGWWIESTAPALVETLRHAMSRSNAERVEMGRRGRALVQERYAWPAIAQQMRSLYGWMLKRGEKPAFVQA